MNEYANVRLIPLNEAGDELLAVSFRFDDGDREFAKPQTSFVYRSDGIAAEWSPPYGPIRIWKECKADHPKAHAHYVFPFVSNRESPDLSQLAVENNGLPQAAVDNRWQHIFPVLRSWAESNRIEASP